MFEVRKWKFNKFLSAIQNFNLKMKIRIVVIKCGHFKVYLQCCWAKKSQFHKKCIRYGFDLFDFKCERREIKCSKRNYKIYSSNKVDNNQYLVWHYHTIVFFHTLVRLCVVVVRPLNMSTGVPYCKRRTHEISWITLYLLMLANLLAAENSNDCLPAMRN